MRQGRAFWGNPTLQALLRVRRRHVVGAALCSQGQARMREAKRSESSPFIAIRFDQTLRSQEWCLTAESLRAVSVPSEPSEFRFAGLTRQMGQTCNAFEVSIAVCPAC